MHRPYSHSDELGSVGTEGDVGSGEDITNGVGSSNGWVL